MANNTKKKILMIDDDKFSQKFYADSLKEAGLEVLIASDGKAGLKKAKTARPDAILLDIVMPELDGFAVLIELKRDAALRAIPVIVLSGAGSDEDLKRCRELGAEQCFSKFAMLPHDLVAYFTQRFVDGVLPAKIPAPMTKAGELSNAIFLSASRQIQTVIEQLVQQTITIGYFKATVVSTEVLKEYLGELTEQAGLVTSYSVLKPPVGAALLLISKEATLALSSLFPGQKPRATAAPILAIELSELYNIISNTFLNVVTKGLGADKILLFLSPMLSTPDMAVRLMRKGRVSDDSPCRAASGRTSV